MRIFPLLILITFAVIAIKIFSVVFDQEPVVSGVQIVRAAETTPATEETPANDEEAPAGDQSAAEAAKVEENKKEIDLLLKNQENKGTKQFFSDTEIRLLQSLKERRDLLDKRERKIDIQAKLLLAAEKQLDSKIAKLTALEEAIKKKLGDVNEEEQGRFTNLVKTYETMKSKEAAGILSVLDLDVMEKIARAMSTKKLAPILAKMNMQAARALTLRLAAPPIEMTTDKIMAEPVVENNSKLPELTLE